MSDTPPPLPVSAVSAPDATPSAGLQRISGPASVSVPPPVVKGKKAAKAPVPQQTEKKRSAIDTLVARDQTAVFWFLVACLIGAGCAWYLVIMAEALKARPPFVVMDTAGAYYVAPGVNFDSVTPMHLNLTQIAVRTMFERGPQGLVKANRAEKLFNRKGMSELKDILKKEDAYFSSQKVEQSVEFYPDNELSSLPESFFPPRKVRQPTTNPAVLIRTPTAVSTWAVGIVTRRGVFKGQNQIELYRFKVIFAWRMNPDPRATQAYPAVVDGILSYNLEKISDL